ncbi:hypothetical protein IWT25_00706 [Secundilactobacillus pentosiphilus]|uniref:Uncharacterized protein n=1 Tax=Secundilactobacillus pentosiphilus TaxID=1714682 RepID=A0A1Z5IUY8_9LACO|nr:hypothetical protein [Secundilactobacillus pentosiphilus]GAX05402.1 hypothetical protein IWT25_00706 [Secundilactobacillus pentosiphilus]
MNSTLKLTIKNIEKKTPNTLLVTLTYTPRNDSAIYTSVVSYTDVEAQEDSTSVVASVGVAVTNLRSILEDQTLDALHGALKLILGSPHSLNDDAIKKYIGKSLEVKAL